MATDADKHTGDEQRIDALLEQLDDLDAGLVTMRDEVASIRTSLLAQRQRTGAAAHGAPQDAR